MMLLAPVLSLLFVTHVPRGRAALDSHFRGNDDVIIMTMNKDFDDSGA